MRHFFVPPKEIVPLENLLTIQTDSYNRFLESGVADVLEEINPTADTTGRGWEVVFSEPAIGQPKTTIADAIRRGITYAAPWYLRATITDSQTSKSRTSKIFMGDLPLLTSIGSFIINGVERAVVNQLTRPPVSRWPEPRFYPKTAPGWSLKPRAKASSPCGLTASGR
jgi:DNA-directed RNA polymerase subunit beta